PAPESTNRTLKTLLKKPGLSLLPFAANTNRHGKHSTMNWPAPSGPVMWMQETLTVPSIAGRQMRLSTRIAKTGSVSQHQCANSPKHLAMTVRLFLALFANVRSIFTKIPLH
ncbi:exonuclease family protein, partial [Escherichia coli 95.0183]